MVLRNILLGLGVLAMIAGVALGVMWLREPSPQQAAEQEEPPAPRPSILVANRSITTGTLLTASDMRWKDLAANQAPPANAMVRGQISETDFVGSVSRRGFSVGEPFAESDLVRPNQGGFLAAVLAPAMRAVSVTVGAAESVAGLVAPGDRVDVILTQTFNDTIVSPTHKSVGETVLHDVRVIAVDQKLDGKGNEAVVARTATLEVTPKQSEIIAVATEMGKLSLSLRSLAVAEETSPADSAGGGERGTFTLDSEVSQLLTKKGNSGADGVTVLRGNSKSG